MTGPAPPAADQGEPGLDGWDPPPRRTTASPLLAVAGFEGPLDWLLDLARTRRIDLARLSISALIEAFEAALAEAIAGLDRDPLFLARWSDWLVMAAELALLRSRLLLPADAEEARTARDEAERLRRSLLSRAAVARAVDWLAARQQPGRDVFLRGQAGDGAAAGARTGDVTALLRACLAAIRLPEDAAARYAVPAPPFWTVLDALARLRAMLPPPGREGLGLAAVLPPVPADAPDRDRHCRTVVSATFLAGLELVRDGVAILDQAEPWQLIRIGPPSPGGE